MRKQTDMNVRVVPLGNGADGTLTNDTLSVMVRETYFKNGWELFHVNVNQISAGVIYYQMTFVKYEDVPEPSQAVMTEEVRAKRPYHRRVTNEPESEPA